ncbi:MAG: hypothetical protein KC443_10000, partial [Anaerolineales bacterium]|nr:hypothetical protein [Anaerolineales bacterium]
ITAVCDAVGLTLSGQDTAAAQLLAYLQQKEMLLLLDNMEHLLTPPLLALIVQIAAQAPDCRLLATSRERLNLQAETLLDLRGLPYPTANDAQSALAAYPAVQLFTSRAQQTRADFVLTGQETAVITLCQLVDGLPLALELAATWTRILTVADIVAEIQQSLGSLTTTLRDIPARHRSLRAVIESSWQLLPAPEQAVMRQLAVFRGGFTRTAAQTASAATLPLLMSLVDRSFLRLDADQRFRRHPLLLQFAQEQLAANPVEQRQAQANHAHYFTTFIEQCDNDLKSGSNSQLIQKIRADFENLRAAWQWLLAEEALPMISRFCPGWERYFQQSGEFAQGRAIFDDAVRQLGHLPLDSDALVWIHCAHGSLAVRTGDNTLAAEILDRCIVAARQLNNAPLQALVLYRAGVNSEYQGKYDEAKARLEEAIHLGEQLDDPLLLGAMFNSLAIVEWMRDELDLAEEHALQGLTYAQNLNNEISVAMRLATLGSIAFAKKEYRRAIAYTEKAYQGFVARNHIWGIGSSLHNLANAWGALGDHEKALAMKLEVAGYEEETGHQWDMAVNHCSIAGTLVELNRLEEAEERAKAGIALAGTETPQVTVYGLGTLGRVEALRGNLLEAVALLMFALQHPAMAGYLAAELQPTLDSLRAELPAALLAQAEKRASAWTLADVLAQMLAV